ncbi:hypothetical protein HDV00_012180 [Rhizophlyctis rosea]|nr:hypothetical protein HDV00_012180 [Rhizophlyctis rosea]
MTAAISVRPSQRRLLCSFLSTILLLSHSLLVHAIPQDDTDTTQPSTTNPPSTPSPSPSPTSTSSHPSPTTPNSNRKGSGAPLDTANIIIIVIICGMTALFGIGVYARYRRSAQAESALEERLAARIRERHQSLLDREGGGVERQQTLPRYESWKSAPRYQDRTAERGGGGSGLDRTLSRTLGWVRGGSLRSLGGERGEGDLVADAQEMGRVSVETGYGFSDGGSESASSRGLVGSARTESERLLVDGRGESDIGAGRDVSRSLETRTDLEDVNLGDIPLDASFSSRHPPTYHETVKADKLLRGESVSSSGSSINRPSIRAGDTII